MPRKTRRLLLTPVAVGALFIPPSPHSHADEVISSPVTTTRLLSGGTNLLIEESGSVTTSANLEDAIVSGNYGNAVNNLGTIATGGSVSFGVYNIGNRFDILNNGLIRTNGFDSIGILNVGSNATIVNAGTIKTHEQNAAGVLNFGNETAISNSGVIRTQGVDAAAITSDATDVTITNTGQLISERFDAIRIDNGSVNTSVKLGAPGYLAGTITFAAPATLTIATGTSHSVLWQLPTTNIEGGLAKVSGSVPWFYDAATGQFAIFDPTGPTARFNQFADTASTLARLGRYGVRQTGRHRNWAAAPAVLSFKSDQAAAVENFAALSAEGPVPETVYGAKAGKFWITGFDGNAEYRGDETTLDQRIGQAGAAIGYAWRQSLHTRLGVMAGYLNGSIAAESPWADAQDIESYGIFAGVYGERRIGTVTAGLGVAGGWQKNASRRFINDNAALTGGARLGESHASASYDSWFLAPEATLAADLTIGRTGLVVTPTLRARYGLQHTGSYREAGSNANATVGAHALGVVEADIELVVSRDFGPVKLLGRAGYLLRGSIGDDDVPVTLVGVSKSVGLGTTNLAATTLGAALDLNLGPQASFTLDGQGTFSSAIDAFQGMARLAIRF